MGCWSDILNRNGTLFWPTRAVGGFLIYITNMQQAETRSTNLALLRVCSIILIVNGLNGMTGMFWNLFTTGECEGRLFFVFLPFVTVAVGVIAIARDSALILKIFALLFILMTKFMYKYSRFIFKC